ncbi:branched-chain amino acid ABC transporter permease [Desulfatiglans anilini]|uniref:branched-chain amino acid ABC transporter permease n=1 Tax=Desulfatiglans anilini TaxID=90728 RepID=UPI0004113756|nr:branched-chain amino acid ABC transporter permease [Desulfatiglans anilini]
MGETIERKKRIDRGVKVRSDSIYAVSSIQELAFLAAPRLGLIFGLLLLPILVPGLYWQRVVCLFGIYALLAVALDFMASYTGLNCLGMAFFVGTGGYFSGMLNAAFNVPLMVSIPVATLLGALFCTLAFLPTLPLRGVYFAVISFMYPLMSERIIAATGAFGGTEGIAGLSILPNIWFSQYLIVVVLLFCIFALRRLVNEDIGLVFRGLKDNDQTIRASGMNITYYKAIVVFITALMGCFAGAYLSHLYGWVGLSLLAMDFSIFPLAAMIIGGPGTIAGPVIGAIILVPVSELMRVFSGLRILFYSIVIIFFILFWSEGLLNWARKKYEQFEFLVKV